MKIKGLKINEKDYYTRGLIKNKLNCSSTFDLFNVGIGPGDSEILTESGWSSVDVEVEGGES